MHSAGVGRGIPVGFPIHKLRLNLALLVALGAGVSISAAVGLKATPALAAAAPRVTLSVPAKVTGGVPAIAKGRVVPAQRGRVLLQVWSRHAWRPAAAGKLREGTFRISFVVQQTTRPQLRVRAILVQGRRSLGSSAVRKVQVRPVRAVSETSPSTPHPATPAVASNVPVAEEEPSPPGKAYWGAWIGSQLTGGAAPWDMNAVSAFEQLVGKSLSLLEFSSPFADCASSPCSYFDFPADRFDAIRAHGAIPFFSWGSQSINSPDQANFQLADVIAGNYDSYIHEWATHAAEWGHPFFLRFDWEMNGSWFAWGAGANGNQPGEFVAAWRHVHDIFTSAGATNATWVWCPYVNQVEIPESLYPGDEYVDWTCLDGYDWGTNPAAPYGWKTFDSLYSSSYADLTEKVAPSKPVLIGETAASEYGGSKAGWIDEMFEALDTGYPRIHGLLWFDTNDSGMDWPLESSEAAADAFAAGISDSRFLGSEFGEAGSSPIPVP
jgi:Glycosyl hydrolase family 26